VNQLTRLVLPTKLEDTLRYLKTQITYLPGDTAYRRPDIFREFIGNEVQRNADLGRQIVSKLGYQSKASLLFLETCSGPGAMVRDLRREFPNSISVAVDQSAAMCSLGRKLSPHLKFVQGDILDPKLVRLLNKQLNFQKRQRLQFNAAFNSASSLGFFSAAELEKHLDIMNAMLNVSTGSYFAEVGYYSSILAASVNNYIKTPGSFRGEKTIDWTVTAKYYPLTDFHEISWSAWSKAKSLLFAMTHKVRALRPSELAQMAKRVGLQFRIWKMVLNSSKRFVFAELDERSFYKFDNEFDILVEFHRRNSPRLDSAK
jgi:hypothetical protein